MVLKCSQWFSLILGDSSFSLGLGCSQWFLRAPGWSLLVSVIIITVVLKVLSVSQWFSVVTALCGSKCFQWRSMVFVILSFSMMLSGSWWFSLTLVGYWRFSVIVTLSRWFFWVLGNSW
jgi:hypothetical protein